MNTSTFADTSPIKNATEANTSVQDVNFNQSLRVNNTNGINTPHNYQTAKFGDSVKYESRYQKNQGEERTEEMR